MKVKRVSKIFIPKKHPDYEYLIEHMLYSKNIYNYINFIIRQKFFKYTKEDYIFRDEIISEYNSLVEDLKTYYDGDILMSKSLLTRVARNFTREQDFEINTKVTTNVCRKLFSDWKSFFELLKLKNEGQYDKDISIPKYKKSNYNLVEFNNQTISKKLKNKKGLLGTKQMHGIKLPNFINFDDITSFRVYYKNSSVIVEVIYEKEVRETAVDFISKNICGADPGLDILLALTFNQNKRPLNIDGKYVKSINQYFNKKISKAKSNLPKGVYTSKNIQKLYNKRESQIRNYFGYVTNKIIDELITNDIDTFVIGYNKEQKQEINLGKRNNQNFVSIPYDKLRGILKYKLEEVGIKYVEQEESYTSKASFLDNDNIPTYKDGEDIEYKFSGIRVKRGMYKAKKGKVIHADINGSYNIMRKAGFTISLELDILKRDIITPLRLA